MSKNLAIFVIVVIVIFLSFQWFFFANYTSDGCTLINKVPYKIKKPGKYCLSKTLNYNSQGGYAIQIKADNVSLDFRQNTLIGKVGDLDSNAIGVYANQVKNLEISNGAILGFLMGIRVVSKEEDLEKNRRGKASENITVSSMRLFSNTYRGMRIESIGSLIINNFVSNTGGALISAADGAIGIESYGPGAFIKGNYVYETKPFQDKKIKINGEESKKVKGNKEGVSISSSFYGKGSFISDNYVANYIDSPLSIGLWVGKGGKVSVDRNILVNTTSPFLSSETDLALKNNLSLNTNGICRADAQSYTTFD